MILDYIESALGEGTYHNTRKGIQYSYKCPFCDDHRERLFINVTNKKFWCHNCERGGTLITFISDYARIPWKKALELFREHDGYDAPLPDELEDEVYRKLHGNIEAPITKYVFPLPDEFILIEDAKGDAGQRATRYLRSRGVSLEMCEKYYIGYCAEGQYANRIIMTDFEGGDLVYWQARTWESAPKSLMLKKMYRKVLNPSLTKEQIADGVVSVDKSEIISNIDYILQDGFAVICEGRMDAYTIGDYGACTHGKHMSDYQFMKLVQNKGKIQTIAVMYDGDAFDSTITTAKRLYKHFDDVLVCKLPLDKDPNSLGAKGCLDALRDAIPYSPMIEVKMRLKGW